MDLKWQFVKKYGKPGEELAQTEWQTRFARFKKEEKEKKSKRTAISRDLHDDKAPVTQAVVDGSLTKDADRDVEMIALLDRKDSAGSQYSPLYWVERIYQALNAKLFSNPQEAYDAIIMQAKGKDLSELQEREIRKWLASMGLGLKADDLNNEAKGYSTIEYRQKQVAAGLTVAGHASRALLTAKLQAAAIKRLGSVLAYYGANKTQLQAAKRVAELRVKGFDSTEVALACKLEGMDRHCVARALLVQAEVTEQKLLKKFRIVVDSEGEQSVHFVDSDSKSSAEKAVKDAYGDKVKISEVEEVGSGVPKEEEMKKEAQAAPPPPPMAPPTPGKRRVFDQKLNAWIEVPEQSVTKSQV